jgi:hypothetical protein
MLAQLTHESLRAGHMRVGDIVGAVVHMPMCSDVPAPIPLRSYRAPLEQRRGPDAGVLNEVVGLVGEFHFGQHVEPGKNLCPVACFYPWRTSTSFRICPGSCSIRLAETDGRGLIVHPPLVTS